MKKNTDLYIIGFALIFTTLIISIFINLKRSNDVVSAQELSVNEESIELTCPPNFDENNISLNWELKIPKYKKWIENLWDAFEDDTLNPNVINSKYKKKFNAELIIKDNNSNKCNLKTEIRLSGDLKDHLKVSGNNISGSLDVSMKKGHVFNITKFKLVFPETRTDAKNVIIGTKILQSSGILTPEHKLVSLNINGNIMPMIFEEKPHKELVERNLYREGLLVESNENIWWDSQIDQPLFVKPINNDWSTSNPVAFSISLKYLKILNYHIISSFKRFFKLKEDNNESYLTSNYVGFDLTDFNEETKYNFSKYDLLLLAMNGWHGLKQHQRQFFIDNTSQIIYPIYKDGDLNFITLDNNFDLNLDNYHANAISLTNQLFINDTVSTLKEIDISKLQNDIASAGVIINQESLASIVNGLVDRLIYFKSIKTTDPDKINLQEAQDYINAYNWPTKFESFQVDIKNSNEIYCTNINIDCKVQKLEIANIFSNINQQKTKYKFFTSMNTFKNSFNETSRVTKNLDGLEITLPSDAKIEKYENEIIFYLKSNDEHILIKDSLLENLKIRVESARSINQISEIRYKEDSLTGCLTIANSELKNISIELNNLECEDSLNILKSEGNIELIKISNSSQDAFDADFSNLDITKVVIKDSGNDCLDLSSGKYNIADSRLENCSDKGVSIGEKSTVTLNRVEIKNATNAIAVKDSSNLNLVNAIIFLKDVKKFGITSYRKKQEFGPSEIHFKNAEQFETLTSDLQEGTKIAIN